MQSRFTQIKFVCVALLSLGISFGVCGQMTAEEIKTQLSGNPAAVGITKPDADECLVTSSYKDAGSGIDYAYIQQTYKGIKVFNNIITLAFKNGSLVYASGQFVNTIRKQDKAAIPLIDPGSAVVTSAVHLRLNITPALAPRIRENRFQIDKKVIFLPDGIAKRDIETELLWVQDDSGSIHLAWNVNIDVINSNNWWNVRVDAINGMVVNKDNWTINEKVTHSENFSRQNHAPVQYRRYQKPSAAPHTAAPLFSPPNVQNASYLVVPFPYESRNFGPLSPDANPWLKAGAGNPSTTYGWHFDGTNNYTYTRGNNTYAYEDSAHVNIPGRVVTSSTPAPSLTFNVSPDFSKQPYDSTNRNFNIVNLFYWNNIIHDVTYQYGFNENAGNFQADNLGRGGAGNDYVLAEAQDGSGTDNANFSTPADGASGRMQMYLFSAPPVFTVTAPSSIAAQYTAAESGLSTTNKLISKGPITGQVVFYDDPASAGTTHEACDSSIRPLQSVAGKIALIYRGTCSFITKFYAAQKAGAIAVIMVNNVAGSPIVMGGGPDNAITIPGLMVSQDDGAKIAAQISNGVTITMSTGILLDGDLDNGVITHEYGHGVSNRLTGGRTNVSCLSNAEQGGEGWSDYLALMLTTNWQTEQLTGGARPRPMGTYVEGQPASGSGIRRVPYSTDMLIDTLTYRSMQYSTEVHNIGEIWCSALWDMTWNIIQHEGIITPDMYNSAAGGGNIIALTLVTEGMKLQPCRPGFLDARNAILAADSILYNYRHKCDIWNAFARRGMGVSAVQGLSTSALDQVPAFDVPSGIMIKKSAVPDSLTAGTNITMKLSVSCQCQSPAFNYTLTDTLPTGFTYQSSSGGTLTGNVLKFSGISFNNSLDSANLTVALKSTGQFCPTAKPVDDDRDTSLTGGFTSSILTGNTNWVAATSRFYSTPKAWYAADSAKSTNFALTSAAFVPGNLSILSFRHYFVVENNLDGGKVELSTDNGATWINASPYFLQNGYNALLNSAAPQPNTAAFTGTSYTTGSLNSGQFIQSLVDLSAFKGLPLMVRFRFQTNATNAGTPTIPTYEGWYIDNIMVLNGCGGISKIALYNASNIKTDSLSIPTYAVPANTPLPVTLVSFTAKPAGSEVRLYWQTSAEANTRDFTVERSTDGLHWTTVGSVMSAASGNGDGKYMYTDTHPFDQKSYYRIRINGKDGLYTYTPVRTVDASGNSIFSVNPNPATDRTTIYFGMKSKGSNVLVTDIQGRILQKHRITDDLGSYTIPTTGLPAGTYLIKMQFKTGSAIRKLIVTH